MSAIDFLALSLLLALENPGFAKFPLIQPGFFLRVLPLSETFHEYCSMLQLETVAVTPSTLVRRQVVVHAVHSAQLKGLSQPSQ